MALGCRPHKGFKPRTLDARVVNVKLIAGGGCTTLKAIICTRKSAAHTGPNAVAAQGSKPRGMMSVCMVVTRRRLYTDERRGRELTVSLSCSVELPLCDSSTL